MSNDMKIGLMHIVSVLLSSKTGKRLLKKRILSNIPPKITIEIIIET